MSRYSKAKLAIQSYIEKAKLKLNLQNSILLISMLAVVYVIGFPLLSIVKTSFWVDGTLDLRAYAEVFTASSTYKAMLNTMFVAFGVLALAGLMGGTLAFLAEKTDIRIKKLMRFFVFLQFCIPSYIISVSWVQIMSRGGYLNRIIKFFCPDFSYSFSPYSLWAVIVVLSIHLYPLVFFGVSNALRRSSGVLENAGKVSGGSPFRVLWTITLPLVLPSILSTSLLVFSRTMANFGIAAQLALPVGSEVLTTRVYKAISELDLQSLSVLSILLVAVSYSIYWITEKWISRRNYTISDSGNLRGRRLLSLRKKGCFVYPLVFLFFFAVLILPLITLVLASLMKRWGLDMCIENMTLQNYRLVLFENDLMKRSFANSLLYGIFSATAASIIAIIIVYFYKHVRNGASRLLMLISSLPLAVPNIILAVGAIFAWINPPMKLYGTKWIIIITYIVLFIPISVKQIKGLSENINPATELSARTLGVPVTKRIFDLFLPQLFRGVVSGWIIAFLIAFREIPISFLLYSKGNETVGVLLFTIQSNSYGLEMTSTVAVLVIIVSVIGNLLVNVLCKKRFENGNIKAE